MRSMRPRPVVPGKHNPGVAGKGASPVGNAGRTVPLPFTATRSEAATKMMRTGFGRRVNIPKRADDVDAPPSS